MRFTTKIALASVSLLAMPNVAFAQAKPADESNAKSSEDIVVTGTLIRGTKVVGSQTITVDAAAITDKGANSTNELLSLIPQVKNTFNGRFEGDPRGFGAGISINRPDLRSLPGYNRATGGVTLVLMDGVRITPVGVGQAAVDVDVIPASVLAGVDAITDGGTSLYGADAIAGVINFRTMKRFDGVKVDGNFGFSTKIKGFSQWDGSVTAGTSWTGGNGYISVSHADRDAVLNGQTPWSTGLIYSAAGVPSFAGTQCISPVGSEVRYFKFGAGSTQWTNNPAAPGAGRFPIGTACDQTSAQTYLPKQVRTNIFASVSQELSDTIDLRTTAYWTKRDITLYGYPAGGATTDAVFVFPASNPPPGTIVSTLGGTGFSYGANSAYVNRPSQVNFETWGITPEVTAKLGDNWQVRTTLHYGQSSNYQSFTGADNQLALSYIASGALNPLNVGAASAAVINDITDYQSEQATKHRMFLVRSIVDGTLFEAPAGDAKLAVGVEYQKNWVRTRLNAGKSGALESVPWRSASANSKSIFGELFVPVMPFLDLSASVRYDSYSNFGSTTNPNLGMTLKPFSWLKLFGHWNTSFNAPTALDQLAVSTGRFASAYSATVRPRDPVGGRDNGLGTQALVLEGSTTGLKPQTASSWAAGFELEPFTGLRLGGEYYFIDFRNALGAIDSQLDSSYLARPDLFVYNKELLANPAILAGYYSQLANGAQVSTQQPLSNIALIADLRTTNLSSSKLEGIDFHANLDLDTKFGHLAFGANGNRQTKALRTTGGTPINDLGFGAPVFTVSTFAGWNKNGASAKVTVNYSGKFIDSAANNVGGFDTIQPFIQTNLNFGYKFDESNGALAGTSLRLGIDNLFDVEPQIVKRPNTNNPTFRNWTLGRVIKFGVSKTF
ncbi:MAG: TonB-dependent receptor [Novosphingobium sp.]